MVGRELNELFVGAAHKDSHVRGSALREQYEVFLVVWTATMWITPP